MENNIDKIIEILKRLSFLKYDLFNEYLEYNTEDNLIVIKKIDELLEMIFNIKLNRIKKKDLQKIKEKVEEIKKMIKEMP